MDLYPGCDPVYEEVPVPAEELLFLEMAPELPVLQLADCMEEMKTIENELKPCPFCGNEAKVDEKRDRNWNNMSLFTVRCTNPECGAEIKEWINQYDPMWFEMVGNFFAKWNRRAEDGK